MKCFWESFRMGFGRAEKFLAAPHPKPTFRLQKFLTPPKTWKYQNFTQNDLKFQVCHLGPNSQSKPFSAFFSKTKGFGENFGPKTISGYSPLLGAPGWQNSENPDFRPKNGFGRNFGNSKIRVLGAGWPIFFLGPNQKIGNLPPKKISWSQTHFGVLEPR